MIPYLTLALRHIFAGLAAYLAAHGFDGTPNTGSLVLGLVLFGIATAWSWLAKLMHLEGVGVDLDKNTTLRTAIGSLISQGITFASAYYAVDANDPTALSVAVLNSVASHYGMHQQIAHQTPLEVATAIKALALGSLIALSSCATATAFLSSPFGRATLATADQLAAQVLKTTERVGLEQIIIQTSAKVAALNNEGINPDPVKETLRLSAITGYTSVIEIAQDKYKALTGARFTLPKNPVMVLP